MSETKTRGARGGRGGRSAMTMTAIQPSEIAPATTVAVTQPSEIAPAVDSLLHDSARAIDREQRRLRDMTPHQRREINGHDRFGIPTSPQERLELGRDCLTLTMMENSIEQREWHDGLCIARNMRGAARISRK